MDIRILTLKRWNPPQRKSIYQEESKKYGEYISFQNYHFFDITEVQLESNTKKSDIFAQAHKTAKNIRIDFYKDAISDDIYIQQNMILFGEKNQFWDKAPKERLYVTMFQLSNRNDVQIGELVKQMREMLQVEFGQEQQWTLYYSLDFCDLVLLVKDISLFQMQSILWKFAPERNQVFSNIRDTITLFGYEYYFLKMCFTLYEQILKTGSDVKRLEDVQYIQKDSRLKADLSIVLSVQDANVWSRLKTELERIISIIPYRILGRCDIQLVVQDVTDVQAICVLYWIDHFCVCENGKQEAFGCYEAVQLTPYDEKNYPTQGQDCVIEESFWRRVKACTDALLPKYEETLQNNGISIDGYAFEFNRALLALLKNGFAEEFALSVFQPFMGYLCCCVNAQQEIRQRPTLFYTFQHNLFQALGTLGQCVMHGERQFIQAPGFNASLFDVPPKLVAFYAGIADRITRVLDYEKENRTFFFLFSPDFRPDFYVKPITFGSEGESKICILYLNEKIFYNPVAVINMMCHEIAHYVGNKARHREERTKAIMECICAYLLYTALPMASNEEQFVDILVTAFSEEILQEYKRWLKSNDVPEAESYYLTRVNDFILEKQYLFHLFKNKNFVVSLQKRCMNALKKFDSSNWIRMQDRTMQTNFLTNLYGLDVPNEQGWKNIDEFQQAANHMLCGFLIKRVLAQGQLWIKVRENGFHTPRAYFTYYQNIFQIFSEAYSDLRMVEILKISDGNTYKNLSENNMEQIYTEKNDVWVIKEFQNRLRYASVRQILDGNSFYVPLDPDNETEEKIGNFCLKKISEYLSVCHTEYREIAENNLSELVKSLQGMDAKQQFLTIRNEIMDYRTRLETYCEKIYHEQGRMGNG